MQAVVLCGGKGERLLPLTMKRPSAMLRICGREMIFYTLDKLVDMGADRITLAVGWGAEQIKELFTDGSYRGIPLDLAGSNETGTAPAVAYAADHNEKCIMIAEANAYFECGSSALKRLVDMHNDRAALCTVLTCESGDHRDRVCVIADENKEINAVISDPSADMRYTEVLAGIYVVSGDIFREESFADGRDLVEDVLTDLARQGGKLTACKAEGYFTRMLYPENFLDLQRHMLEKSDNEIISHTDRNFSGVTIIPPVYIGKNVSISKGSVIGSGTVLDDGCSVGSKSNVTCSYVGENAVISEMCGVMSAVISDGAELGKNTKAGINSAVGAYAVIESDCEIEKNASVKAESRIGAGTIVRDHMSSGRESCEYIDDEGVFTLSGTACSLSDAVRFGSACGTALQAGASVVSGYSGREGSSLYAKAVNCGIAAVGCNVIDIGECTLPQLAYAAKFYGAELGIFTELNTHCSINIMSAAGLRISRKMEDTIETNYRHRKIRCCKEDGSVNFGKTVKSDGEMIYLDHLKKLVPHKFCGVSAQIRANDRLTAVYSDIVIHKLNDISGERIVFHISSDGRKCTAFSESAGNVTWEDFVCIAAAEHFKAGKAVSLPVCFPASADSSAEDHCGRLYRYVRNSEQGGEAVKTAQRTDNLFVRDGLALCCEICRILSENHITLGAALKGIHRLYTTERYISSACSRNEVMKKFGGAHGERYGIYGAYFENSQARAHIIPLKRAGGIMVYAESTDCECAAAICDEIAEKIKRLESHR